MKSRISRYQLLKHLHSGATADLFLGSYEVNGEVKYAALKQIRATHAQDQQFLQRFLGEVQLAIALGHKHLVEVHDVLGTEGDYVIAMEYVHGSDLRTVLAHVAQRGDNVPVEHIGAIGSAVAAGLHHAHELRDDHKRSLGVVHRNVSPSNILLGYDGSIKLGDFGTPMAAMQRGGADVAGRVSYFSPEQCKGGELDRRSDVYSLGVVLYELATASRLFWGDDDEQVVARIVRGEVAAPRTLRPDLPSELSAIILRAIAVDPAKRYASAGELRAALDKFAGKRSPAASLGAYVREHVGERPEPWRDLTVVPPPSFLTGNTWIEPPRGKLGTADSIAAAAPSETPRPVPVRRARGVKLAMIGVPLVAIAGGAVWQLARAGGSAEPTAPPISAAAPAVAQPAVAQPSASAPATPAAPASSTAPVAAAPAPSPAPVAAAPDHAPASSAAAPPGQTVASAEPSAPHLARTAEPTGHSARPRTESTASSKISTARTNETVHASAPAAEPVAAPVVGPAAPKPLPAPPAPVAVSAPAAPVVPPPAPAPAPVAALHVVTSQVLDANRISGNWHIVPDANTLLAMKQARKDKVTAAFKLCVNTEGGVSVASALQSTGYAAFDAKIENTIREKWRYRPFVIDGQRSSVCTSVAFVYWPPVL